MSEMDSSRRPANSLDEETVGGAGPSCPSRVPPDGGYGWVIVFADFIVKFVTGSIMPCFGIVYVYLVQSGYTNAQVAIAPAIMNALTNLLAPFSTALSRYYSHRRLVCLGVALVASGLFICSFSSHIILFYVSYGVVIGTGTALLSPQGFLASQKYFTSKRVTANSLPMLGTSIGFMTFPILLNHFVQEYSHRGSFILWSGIVLHGFIGASLLHPVEWHMKPNKTIPLKVLTRRNTAPDMDGQRCAKYDRQQRNSLRSSVNDDDSNEDLSVCGDESDLPELEKPGSVGDLLNRSIRRKSGRSSSLNNARQIFGSSSNVDAFGSSNSAQMEAGNVELQDAGSVCCGMTVPHFSEIFNFTLLKNPAFLISSCSSVSNRMVYMCFVTYLPSISQDLGLKRDTPYLMMCIAVFELIANVTTSIISDRCFMPRRYFIIFASTGACISCLSVTFSRDFWSLALCCCGYGFCVGIIICVGPVLLVEYLGLELLPYSYGLLLFMNGFSGLVIFTVTGLLNDMAGNYVTTYIGLSFLSLVAAVLWSSINLCYNALDSDHS
ncbi:monocarboxylate transporter 7-like isoform X2 [Macrobrachium nipponense]|uniref:monocarboxylate transporter 7-like isoform X2 n=1 Tax=Macrobrachium nipponense TaxID=159736 RepID=UPI0030C848E8